MLVIHKLDGTDWFVKGIELNTNNQGLITIRLLMLPDFETAVLEQAITRIFNDKEMASKEFDRLKKIMDTPGKAVFGIGKDFALNYVKSVNGTMGSLDGLPFISRKDEEEKTTTLPATCQYCSHEGNCDQQVGDEGHIADCPYFDYKVELPECVNCEERFEKPQVGYKLVCPACIKKGYFQEHTDEYKTQQLNLLKKVRDSLKKEINDQPPLTDREKLWLQISNDLMIYGESDPKKVLQRLQKDPEVISCTNRIIKDAGLPQVVKGQLNEDFVLYGSAYLVTEKEGDSIVYRVISPKDLTIISSIDNVLIEKDKIGDVLKKFGCLMWPLTCPHCQSMEQIAVHLTDTVITDHNVTLACYCHKCQQKFKASYVSPIGPVIAPRTKCQDMKVVDCVGCPYFIKDECQHPRNTGTSAIE